MLGSASADYNLSRDEPGSEKQTEEEFSLGSEPATEIKREKISYIEQRTYLRREVSGEGDKWIAEATNMLSGPTPEAMKVTSEDRVVADMDVIASKQDAPVAEAVKETAARKESFLSEHSGQFGQQTSSETRLQDKDLQDQSKGKEFFIVADLSLFKHTPFDWFNCRCVFNPSQNQCNHVSDF